MTEKLKHLSYNKWQASNKFFLVVRGKMIGDYQIYRFQSNTLTQLYRIILQKTHTLDQVGKDPSALYCYEAGHLERGLSRAELTRPSLGTMAGGCVKGGPGLLLLQKHKEEIKGLSLINRNV